MQPCIASSPSAFYGSMRSKYSKVAYISVTRNDASEAACIIACVNKPKWRLITGQEGGPKFPIVQGDQVAFHVIFEKLMASIRAQDPGGSWEWLVLICGGFHSDKTCLLETVKIRCRRSGMCALVGDAGVTKGFADLWMEMSHRRKCRQIVHQFITAFTLALIERVSDEEEDMRAAFCARDENSEQLFNSLLV